MATIDIDICSPAALEALSAFAGALLSHGCDLGAIIGATRLDPGCALVATYATTPLLLGGEPQAARRQLAGLRRRIGDPCGRLARTHAAFTAWAAGSVDEAADRFRSIVKCWPEDIVAAKLAQVLEIELGDVAGMQRTAAALLTGPPQRYSAGLAAFALVRAGEPDRALELARAAVGQDARRDPWAQHAIAHALSDLDRPAEARAFLRFHAPSWDRCEPRLRHHLWAHLAKAHLRCCDSASALAIVDDRLMSPAGRDEAAALLLQIELAGAEVEERWEELADLSAPEPTSLLEAYVLRRTGTRARPREVSDLGRHLLDGIAEHIERRSKDAAVALGQARRSAAFRQMGELEREVAELLLEHHLTARRSAA